MSSLALFTFDQWTKLQVVGAQAKALADGNTLDFAIGSDTLALAEGATSAILYLQADIIQLLALTRAATSTGIDLDTWFADFNFPRLPSSYTTGVINLHRDQGGAQIATPADGSAFIVSADGSQTYSIVASIAQPTYNAGSNSYVTPAGATDVTVSIQALTAGSGANTPPGSVLLVGSNVGGFDTAVAVAGFSDGGPIETDAAYRARFILFLGSLSRGTLAAIRFAVATVQQGITATIDNNRDTLGNFEPGNFVVTVDDGSGNPTAALIAAVDAAVGLYCGNTISHNTRGPSVLYTTVGMTIDFDGGLDNVQVATALANVQTAIRLYINALPLGTSLSLTKLSGVAYDVSDNITNVAFVTINGLAADLTVIKSQVVKLLPVGGLNVVLGTVG